MKINSDPNELFKKELTLVLVIIVVLTPFIFLYFKYQDQWKNSENIIDKSNINPIEINFSDVRKMQLSNDQKYLYVYGHDRSGISIFDIHDTKNIKLLSTFLFPNIVENYVSEIDVTETKDGKKLYIVSPYLGLYCFDISDKSNLKLEKIIKIKEALKISLTEDEKKAFIRSDKGIYVVDLSLKSTPVIGEYISTNSIANLQANGNNSYPIDLGDIQVYDDQYVFLLDRKGLHLLDVSDLTNIKSIFDIGTLGKGRQIILSPNKLHIYIVSVQNNIEFFDISDFKNIKSLGGYTSNNDFVNELKIFDNGTKAILLGGRYNEKDRNAHFYEIEIVDISYPLDPNLIKKFKLNVKKFSKFAISPDNKYIYVNFSHKNKYKYKSYVFSKEINLKKE
ncbi:hypothetical protein ACMC56_01325 [Campylobacterota bacterium DY0563]